MPLFESYAQGTPSWTDLMTTDQDAAKSFYSGVFGWTYQDNPVPDGGVYSMAQLEGQDVTAISLMDEESAKHRPSSWNTYITVDDVDAATAKVAGAGGMVMMEPFDVMDAGRMSFVADPTGAAVAFWQAKEHIGATIANEPGTVIWNECFTDDVEAAATFYDTVLGTNHVSADMGGPDPYTVLNVGENTVGGYLHKDVEAHGEMPNVWIVYFASADIADTVDRINAAGGKVLNGPFDTPVGPMIVAQDPQGAVFQAMQPAQ